MARLITIGYEVDQPRALAVGPENPNGSNIFGTGTVTRDASNQRTGSGCAKFDSTAGNLTVVPLAQISLVSKTMFWRVYMMFPALPGTTAQVMGVANNGGTLGISARLTTGGKLQLWNNTAGTQIGSDSAATIATGTYYRLEMKGITDGSNNLTDCELQLDGVSVASASGLTVLVSACVWSCGWISAPGASKICYADDAVLNDSTGSFNNTWPGSGKVVMLVPTSDSAVGTGWVLGNNTAEGGSGWDAINNRPPVGIADLGGVGADTGQIRNATAAANANFDANLTTYTAAGIGASDTINAVIPWVATAAPVTTAAKLGTIGVASNPVITNVNLGAAGTAAAFWQGNAGSTYPTGWKWSPGTITEAPTVTKGTAPVARITQVTSSTRIAMACFVGLYVDYTPAVVVSDTIDMSRRLIPRRRVVYR